MKRYQLLIVEDDKELAQLTFNFFQQFEFECTVLNEGQLAIDHILKNQPDIVLLDLMLPDMDGLQICQLIKGKFKGKVIMLTARTDTLDQVLGLEMGADDYIAKPVVPRLLLAKTRAVLRRDHEKNTHANLSEKFHNIEIIKQRREVLKDGKLVDVTNAEYELLLYLVDHKGEVVNRNQIFLHLRGIEYDGISRQVDTTISALRIKLEEDPNQPVLIKTIRTKGYLFAGT